MQSNNSNPLVSVVIPSYNHEKYIQQCINSITSQTYKNIEIIIIDDYSTDNTAEILKTLENKKTKLIFNERNMGISATLNKGFSIANGEYIAVCASDDAWHPKKIEKQIELLLKNPDAVLCYTAAKFMNNAGKITGTVGWAKNSNTPLNDLLKNGSFIPAGSSIYKKESLIKTGGFDENLKIEDLDFFIKIAKLGKFIFINEALFYYRQHATNTAKNHTDMYNNQLVIINKHRDSARELGIDIDNEWVLNFFYMYARHHKAFAIKNFLKKAMRLKNINDKRLILGLARILFPC